MWVPWNIFLKAYVNKNNLHEFQSKFFLSRSTQLPHGSLWWNSNTFKRVDTTKTCVAVSIFSRKIRGLLCRSLSVGTLICRASLIKHLLIISSFISLYNSARRGSRGKLRLWKRNSDRHSSSLNHRSWTGLNRSRVEVRHRLTHLRRGLSRVYCKLLSMKSS